MSLGGRVDCIHTKHQHDLGITGSARQKRLKVLQTLSHLLAAMHHLWEHRFADLKIIFWNYVLCTRHTGLDHVLEFRHKFQVRLIRSYITDPCYDGTYSTQLLYQLFSKSLMKGNNLNEANSWYECCDPHQWSETSDWKICLLWIFALCKSLLLV